MWLAGKVLAPLRRFLERRRFPTLFVVLAALFAVNLFVPDPLPFVDELIMLVVAVIVGAFRRRRGEDRESEKR
ncbi:MAG: DUF6116 family protein [Wenzhouxiangella sp.]